MNALLEYLDHWRTYVPSMDPSLKDECKFYVTINCYVVLRVLLTLLFYQT